jgi:hypothetical protein
MPVRPLRDPVHRQLDVIKTEELAHCAMIRSGGITPANEPRPLYCRPRVGSIRMLGRSRIWRQARHATAKRRAARLTRGSAEIAPIQLAGPAAAVGCHVLASDMGSTSCRDPHPECHPCDCSGDQVNQQLAGHTSPELKSPEDGVLPLGKDDRRDEHIRRAVDGTKYPD